MNPLAFLLPYKWVAIAGLLIGAVVGCYALSLHLEAIGYDHAANLYQGKIDQQKLTAAGVLATETEKTSKAERSLADAKNTQELKDEEHKTTVAGLAAQLRARAGAGGRLRDPNATRCGSSGGGAASPAAGTPSASTDDAAQAGGLLSAELTGLLQRQATEADAINNAYASCRADSISLRVLQH